MKVKTCTLIVWIVLLFAGFEIVWVLLNHRTYTSSEEVYLRRIGVVPGSLIEYHWERTGREEAKKYISPFISSFIVRADKDGVRSVSRDGALYWRQKSGIVEYTSPYGFQKEISSQIYEPVFEEAERFLQKTRKRFSGFLSKAK